jgi:hypothetical protein
VALRTLTLLFTPTTCIIGNRTKKVAIGNSPSATGPFSPEAQNQIQRHHTTTRQHVLKNRLLKGNSPKAQSDSPILTLALQALRQTAFSAIRPAATPVAPSPFLLSVAAQRRLLSDAVRQAIDKAVASAPVVLFMKGTPETPQCGFSRASIQVLGLQGVNPEKFAAYNVLEDQELRQGALLPP